MICKEALSHSPPSPLPPMIQDNAGCASFPRLETVLHIHATAMSEKAGCLKAGCSLRINPAPSFPPPPPPHPSSIQGCASHKRNTLIGHWAAGPFCGPRGIQVLPRWSTSNRDILGLKVSGPHCKPEAGKKLH